jgi:hypothetical protein
VASGSFLRHGVGGQADHVEAADQVDRDGLAEHGQVVRAVLADGLLGRRDAGAVDQAHQLAELERGLGHDRLAVGFLAHVALDEHAADVFRNGFALVSLHVGDHDLAAVGRQHARRAFAEARSATGHDENLAVDLH